MTQVNEETKLFQCTIQSVLGYFGNDVETFKKSENYLKTIDTCTQNAYSLQCLAKYGGPIEPGIAVGGMPKPEQGKIYILYSFQTSI